MARSRSAARCVELFGEEQAYSFATANQIVSMIAHALPDSFRTSPATARWQEAHRAVDLCVTAYLLELERIADIFAASGIRLVALKNGGIARGIYPCPGCCPMGDLDLLVAKGDFRRAHQLLLRDGYHFEFRSPLEEARLEVAEKGGGAEYWKLLPNGNKLWLELQWRPVAGRWLRIDQEPTAEELIGRSIPVQGMKVRILSPEDNLIQVALHTAKHSYVRAPGFRLHLDVERIVRYQKIDWDIFLERVLLLQVKTPVYFSLLLPRDFFQTPIPDSVLGKLRPRKWKETLILRWLNRAGFFNPDAKKFDRVRYILFNSLLFDDLRGLLRGVSPDVEWMMKTYDIKSRWHLPYYYLKRLGNLVFHRSET